MTKSPRPGILQNTAVLAKNYGIGTTLCCANMYIMHSDNTMPKNRWRETKHHAETNAAPRSTAAAVYVMAYDILCLVMIRHHAAMLHSMARQQKGPNPLTCVCVHEGTTRGEEGAQKQKTPGNQHVFANSSMFV